MSPSLVGFGVVFGGVFRFLCDSVTGLASRCHLVFLVLFAFVWVSLVILVHSCFLT